MLNALPETTKLWKGMSHKWKNAGNGGWTILNSMHYNETETNGGLPMELRKKWRSSVRNNTNRCKTLMVSRREERSKEKGTLTKHCSLYSYYFYLIQQVIYGHFEILLLLKHPNKSFLTLKYMCTWYIDSFSLLNFHFF